MAPSCSIIVSINHTRVTPADPGFRSALLATNTIIKDGEDDATEYHTHSSWEGYSQSMKSFRGFCKNLEISAPRNYLIDFKKVCNDYGT